MGDFTPVLTNNLRHVLKNVVQARDFLRDNAGQLGGDQLRYIRKLNIAIDFVKEALNEDGPMPPAASAVKGRE